MQLSSLTLALQAGSGTLGAGIPCVGLDNLQNLFPIRNPVRKEQ